MYYKLLAIIIACLISVGICNGQSGRRGYADLRYLTVDSALYKITYNVDIVRDTANRENVTSAYVVTLVGKEKAKAEDYYTFVSDSLRMVLVAQNASNAEIMERRLSVQRNRFFREEILLDYPSVGELVFQESISGDFQRVYDADCSQKWEIKDDVTDILGYECRKAECSFRGRKYEAWYAEDLPMPRGPYYFQGLPGLIVRLSDSDGDYKFSLIGLEMIDKPFPITLYDDSGVEKVSREDFKFLKDYYNADRAAAFTGLNNIKMELSPEEIQRINSPRPYNPIERE